MRHDLRGLAQTGPAGVPRVAPGVVPHFHQFPKSQVSVEGEIPKKAQCGLGRITNARPPLLLQRTMEVSFRRNIL